jgi:hypothetical protein
VLNPRRYTDPFLTDEQDAKLGVPALQANWYPPAGRFVPPNLNLTLVWVPVPFPVRFPLVNERWFPPAIRRTPSLVLPAGGLGPNLPPADIVIGTALAIRNRRPPQQLDEVSWVRLSVSGVDWAFSYYDGDETAPNFQIEAEAGCADPKLVNGVCNITRLSALGILEPVFTRMRQVGGDAAFQVAGVTARLEAAYGMDRRFARPSSALLTLDASAVDRRPVEGRQVDGWRGDSGSRSPSMTSS